MSVPQRRSRACRRWKPPLQRWWWSRRHSSDWRRRSSPIGRCSPESWCITRARAQREMGRRSEIHFQTTVCVHLPLQTECVQNQNTGLAAVSCSRRAAIATGKRLKPRGPGVADDGGGAASFSSTMRRTRCAIAAAGLEGGAWWASVVGWVGPVGPKPRGEGERAVSTATASKLPAPPSGSPSVSSSSAAGISSSSCDSRSNPTSPRRARPRQPATARGGRGGELSTAAAPFPTDRGLGPYRPMVAAAAHRSGRGPRLFLLAATAQTSATPIAEMCRQVERWAQAAPAGRSPAEQERKSVEDEPHSHSSGEIVE